MSSGAEIIAHNVLTVEISLSKFAAVADGAVGAVVLTHSGSAVGASLLESAASQP